MKIATMGGFLLILLTLLFIIPSTSLAAEIPFPTLVISESSETTTPATRIAPRAGSSVQLNSISVHLHVGHTRTIQLSVLPATVAIDSVSWSVDQPFITISDTTSPEIQVVGIAEGSPVLTAIVETSDGETHTITYRMNVHNSVPIGVRGFASRATNLLWYAHPDAEIRGRVQAGFGFNVASSSGNFFWVGPSDPNFIFDDHAPQYRDSWVLKEDVTIVASTLALCRSELTLGLGESEALQGTITPDFVSDPSLRWTSSNPQIIAVDQNGLVTAHKMGFATITATTTCGVVATSVVSVSPPASSAPRATLNFRFVSTGINARGTLSNRVRFNAVSGARSYVIHRRVGTGSWTRLRTFEGNRGRTFTDSRNLASRLTYTYRVRARNASGRTIAQQTIRIRPGRVTRLEATTRSTTSIRLEWRRVRGATGYNIQRRVGNDWRNVRTVRQQDGATIRVNVNNLARSSNHTFRVRAYRTIRVNNRARTVNLPWSTTATAATVSNSRIRQTRAYMNSVRGVLVRTPNQNATRAQIHRHSVHERFRDSAGRWHSQEVFPPIKYRFVQRTGELDVLEIHIYAHFISGATGRTIAWDSTFAREFRAGVNGFFHNRAVSATSAPFTYAYQTRVVWHNFQNRGSQGMNRNQRFVTIQNGASSDDASHHCGCAQDDWMRNWYHAHTHGPLGPINHIVIPTAAQVESVDMYPRYASEMRAVKAHEMGHIFGLGDAYAYTDGTTEIRRMTRNREVGRRINAEYFANFMKDERRINTALPNDFEMMLQAYNNRASDRSSPIFQHYRTHTISGRNYIISTVIHNRRDE